MDIKVLGPGCSSCKKLYSETEKALQQLGLEATLTKVEKIEQIIAFHVMATPALVVNGSVKASGRIPSQAELTNWLATAALEQ